MYGGDRLPDVLRLAPDRTQTHAGRTWFRYHRDRYVDGEVHLSQQTHAATAHRKRTADLDPARADISRHHHFKDHPCAPCSQTLVFPGSREPSNDGDLMGGQRGSGLDEHATVHL